jgi:hypothetical protein
VSEREGYISREFQRIPHVDGMTVDIAIQRARKLLIAAGHDLREDQEPGYTEALLERTSDGGLEWLLVFPVRTTATWLSVDRRTVVAVWVAIGAAIGFVALFPVGREVRHGPPNCTTCGNFTVVASGAHFREPYNELFMALIAALVLGTVFGLAAWGLSRLFSE